MKNFIILILFCLLYVNNFGQQSYTGQSIEEILKLPESEINVGIASLVLAKEFYPNLNIPFFLQTFDYLADRYIYFFGKETDPDMRIRALNTYLYQPGYWNDSITFTYDDDDLHVTELSNKFINGYISSRKGSCITMPMLYVIIAERLGFPIYAVRSAKHFFVRYETESFEQNIETTNGGSIITNKQYKDDVLIPDRAVKNGVYLRTLNKKEYIASLLLVNSNEYLKAGNSKKAKKYLKLAMKIDPTFSSAYNNYGITLFGEARQLEDKMWNEKNEAINKISARYMAVNQNKFAGSFNAVNNFNNIDNTLASIEMNEEIKSEVERIENKYKNEILAKIADYKMYVNKAKELGIVYEFPLRFYEKQAESIKEFKIKGGY